MNSDYNPTKHTDVFNYAGKYPETKATDLQVAVYGQIDVNLAQISQLKRIRASLRRKLLYHAILVYVLITGASVTFWLVWRGDATSPLHNVRDLIPAGCLLAVFVLIQEFRATLEYIEQTSELSLLIHEQHMAIFNAEKAIQLSSKEANV